MMLGKHIRDARRSQRLSVRQLADASGVAMNTIYNFERGEVKSPSFLIVAALADVLNISLDELKKAEVTSAFFGKEPPMKEGVLVYDSARDRIDIRFGVLEFYGGLKRGDELEVHIDDRWIPTRIERNTFWYLWGIRTADLNGLHVRIATT